MAQDSALLDPPSTNGSRRREAKVLIIGTGFSGLGMAARLKQTGEEDFLVIERRSDVGGTWHDNTYPGCACDVPSNLYSFSFALNPDWSESFSPQPEIRAYLEDVATREDIRRHVHFDTTVTEARWDEDRARWIVVTDRGTFEARILVAGLGALSEPAVPEVAGLDRFEGAMFHTAAWDHDYDLTGKRVAVIGTGASSIQVVPAIQPVVGHLDLYQRTPPWIMPRTNRPLTRIERFVYRRVPTVQKLVRNAIYWARELMFLGFKGRSRVMQVAEVGARKHLAEQVRDPALRARLEPDYAIGCKRILLSNDYYPALTQPNVELVTAGIAEVRAHSVVDVEGNERPVDAIVLGTGFHVTDMPAMRQLFGIGGQSLEESFGATGMRAYKGTTFAGFPNLFMLMGPNTGLGHTSMVYMIESQVQYTLDAIKTMDAEGIESVAVTPERVRSFNDGVHERMRKTVWMRGGCTSWYIDDHGRNPILWPDFTFRFRRLTRRFDAEAYDVRPIRAATAAPALSGAVVD